MNSQWIERCFSKTYFVLDVLRTSNQHCHQNDVSDAQRHRKYTKIIPVHLLKDIEGINHKVNELLGDQDEQSQAEDAIQLFGELHYQAVILFPVNDFTTGSGVPGDVVEFNVLFDGSNAGRGEPSQRREQDDKEAFVQFAHHDTDHFEHFQATSFQFIQSKAVIATYQLLDNFLTKNGRFSYWFNSFEPLK